MNINYFIRKRIGEKAPIAEVYAEVCAKISKTDFYKLMLSMIRSGEIPNVLICCCGHDCSRCKTFIATLNGDTEMKKEIAGFYKTEFKQDISTEKIHCFSAKSDEIMEGCLSCPFTACCKKKNVALCAECEEYPCGMLRDYQEKYVNRVNQV